MRTGAKFSVDETHRYVLWRVWQDSLPKVCFVGLNPSTANAQYNDHTITKLINICYKQGYGGFNIVNLFSKKGTDFDLIKFDDDLNTIQSNYFLWRFATKSDLICPMWGNKGSWKERNLEVLALLKKVNKPLHCFNITGKNQPQHPLMMSNDTKFILWPNPYEI